MTRSTNMEHVEVLRDLSEVCRAAIKAGDWKVDGACDPDAALRRADAAIASLSAPQPPAEAQGGWDLKEVVCLACGDHIMPMGQVCHACSHPVSAPPSAPVGVDAMRRAAEELRRADALARKTSKINRRKIIGKAADNNLSVILSALAQQPAAVCHCYTTDPTNCIGTDDLAGLDCPCKCHAQQPATCVGCEGKPAPENTPCAVCGQQPAAIGEEIMVNAHDVYTLPLQPSGLSSGPRFVVHVPGPEQPAVVDSEMVTRAVNAYDEATGEGWQMPCLQGMRAALTAALAAQQGGAE